LGGVSSNPYFGQVSFGFFNESNTPTRLIPSVLATSAAGCPISSTASQATRDLAFFEPQRREGSFGFFPDRGGILSGKENAFVWVL
jgi:hypothetical protein